MRAREAFSQPYQHPASQPGFNMHPRQQPHYTYPSAPQFRGPPVYPSPPNATPYDHTQTVMPYDRSDMAVSYDRPATATPYDFPVEYASTQPDTAMSPQAYRDVAPSHIMEPARTDNLVPLQSLPPLKRPTPVKKPIIQTAVEPLTGVLESQKRPNDQMAEEENTPAAIMPPLKKARASPKAKAPPDPWDPPLPPAQDLEASGRRSTVWPLVRLGGKNQIRDRRWTEEEDNVS